MSEPSRPGVRFNQPFLHGLYLALNAVSDAYFLGDGPSCVFAKGEHIHGRHDLFSTLLSCASDHRIQYTGVNIFSIAGNFEAQIGAALKRIAGWPDCGVIFTGAMPMCAIAGSDYERIMREALAGCDKPSFLIPRRSSISGDWLDGYGGALAALASGMDLARARPVPGTAAIVGYLMDRNEGDHQGNVRELERMLRALGIESVSLWLSGRPYEHLRQARRAGAVISLPHGRAAARILAERLGVKLIEAELPFGTGATRRFMEKLGREFGREAEARDFIAKECGAAQRQAREFISRAVAGRRFAFAGDPHYAWAFAEFIEESGGRIAASVVMGGEEHLPEVRLRELKKWSGPVFEPNRVELHRYFAETTRWEVDLLVCNSFGLTYIKPKVPWLEFGFPSEHAHVLNDEAFLGFKGAHSFLSRMGGEMMKDQRLKGARR
ncbi:MAG: nitrogenase component 1 [Elusimicrobiota bacterium]